MENVLDMDALPDLVVNAAYSPELRELKDEMDEIKGEVEELHEEARDGWCAFGEKVCSKRAPANLLYIVRLVSSLGIVPSQCSK